MGFDEDLKTATEMAIRNMITFLSEQIPDHPHISRDDAYALISVACDVDITQLVDTKSGVHVMCPKALFTTPVTPISQPVTKERCCFPATNAANSCLIN